MNAAIRAMLGIALAVGTAGAAWADEAPKDAKGLLQKAVKASAGQEGYHFSLKSSSQAAAAAGGMMGGGGGGRGGGGGAPSGLDGKGLSLKTGVTHLDDANLGDIWMKGRKTLVKRPGESEYKVPESLGPAGAAVSRLVRTPNDVAEDMLRLSGSAKVEGDEKLSEVDCWVVSTVGDKAAVDAFLKQMRERAGGMAAAFLGASQFDTDKAAVNYKAWIGKDDGLLYRIENQADIPLKGGGNPLLGGGGSIDQKTEIEYLAYNRDLELLVPPDVKRKLGIK